MEFHQFYFRIFVQFFFLPFSAYLFFNNWLFFQIFYHNKLVFPASSLSLSRRIFNKLILFEVTVLISGKALYTVTSTLHNAFTLHKRSSLRNSSNRFSKVHSLLLFFNGFRTQIPIHEFQSNVYIRVYIYIYIHRTTIFFLIFAKLQNVSSYDFTASNTCSRRIGLFCRKNWSYSFSIFFLSPISVHRESRVSMAFLIDNRYWSA